MFHNLRGYDSHLIFCQLSKFDVKIDVIPNRLGKYMVFILKYRIIIDSMQFMNSSLAKTLKNLSDDDFKYLTQEFGSENLELQKQKDAHSYEYMNRFGDEKWPDEKCLYGSLKDETTGDNGKKLNRHVSGGEHLICIKTWHKFNMKNMGAYHDHYLKKDVLLADIFEKFADTCLKFYKLDPCHYFNSPGLSWDTVLKMIEIILE